MRKDPPLFTQEIAGFILKVFSGYPDHYSQAEVHIWAKNSPKIGFIIRTKFLVKLPNGLYKEYFHLNHLFKKSRKILAGYKVELKDGLISVYNTDIKMRICRIPIDFLNKTIELCEDALLQSSCQNPEMDSGKDQYCEINIRDTNEQIGIRGLFFNTPYFEEKEDKAFAAWITVLEYEEMPSYEIILKKFSEKVIPGK